MLYLLLMIYNYYLYKKKLIKILQLIATLKIIQGLLAENIKNHKLSSKFSSLNACAKALKADRATLRLYLQNKSKKTYFRDQ